MNEQQRTSNGLDAVIELLGLRYELDEVGRLDRVLGDGILPRFVLGRSAEGCVWRFSAHLEADRVVAIARLAARESGFPIITGMVAPPPDRLVMIERLLFSEGAEPRTAHEVLMRDDLAIAEVWTIG